VPDALLAYSTVKIVRIQDRRVGLVHYAFLLGIVGYIVGFTILFQQRYLLLQRPVGAVRVSLQSVPPPLLCFFFCYYGAS
jgi:hypothetical protein